MAEIKGINIEYYTFYERVGSLRVPVKLIKCKNCSTNNLNRHHNFCPNCGIKFNKGGF